MTRGSPHTAVIVSRFERPRAIELVLAGLETQTDRDFQIVVADDGSGPETAALVQREELPWRCQRGLRASVREVV